MLLALLCVAVLAAAVGAAMRNLTAIALLASFVVSEAMCQSGVPFNLAVWLLIDAIVLAVIIRRGMKLRDWIIVASFVPVWAIYVLEPIWTREGVGVIVAGQMLLTFPVRRLWKPLLRQWARFNDNYDPWGDLKAYA